ncbi:hypothetical protein CBS101457_001960 [Exobasidium rhododendri]|nr:hypothetical protein CBS101457_001960 [Exobasidium rhododendri]
MGKDANADSAAPRRELRERTSLPPYRPRPALTSSDRGKANAEIRRRREVEANMVFTEANDLHMIGSSCGVVLSGGTASEGDNDEMENGTLFHNPGEKYSQQSDSAEKLGSNEGGSSSVAQRDICGSEDMQDEQDVTLELGVAGFLLPEQDKHNTTSTVQQPSKAESMREAVLMTSTPWTRTSQGEDGKIEPVLELHKDRLEGPDESIQGGAGRSELTLSETAAIKLPVASAFPLPSINRTRDNYDFDSDDEFDVDGDDDLCAQLALKEVSDSRSRRNTSAMLAAEALARVNVDESSKDLDGFEVVDMNRQKYPETDGFRWGNDKVIQLAKEAIQTGQKIVARIKKETEAMENPLDFDLHPSSQGAPVQSAQQSSSSSQPVLRSALAPMSASRLNQTVTPRLSPEVQGVALGKRKFYGHAVEISDAMLSTPVRPAPSLQNNTPDRMSSQPSFSPSIQTPLRSKGPLRLGTTHRSTTFQGTPSGMKSSSAVTSKPVPLNTPRTPRLSLGITPRRATSGSVPRFKTPFKDPNRCFQQLSDGSQRSSELSKTPYGSSLQDPFSPSSTKSVHLVTPAPKSSPKVIFNLDKGENERQTYRSMGFEPEGTSDRQIRSQLNKEEYDSITQILNEPKKARRYAFELGGGYFGVSSAHGMLLAESTTSGGDIPRSWVENHWIFILWKLAAYTRHVLDYRFWHWDEVCRQLKYRFEREVNRTHCSAIKRILRQDRPSTSSMVLCVFEIEDSKTFIGDEGEEVEGQALILTDGWYKIRASIDTVLASAIERGRDIFVGGPCIKVGTKLAIQGAQLDSDTSMRDPVKAFDLVTLALGGNSAKLAKWDARLGFVKEPFISTVRSLSALGGNVPLMDIVIARIYPLAFTGSDVCPGYKSEAGQYPEWGAEEEQTRRAQWQTYQEEVRQEVQGEAQARLKPLQHILEQLEQALEGFDGSYDEGFREESCEDMLDAIIEAGDASSYLRMAQFIPTLRKLANKRYEKELEKVGWHFINSSVETKVGVRKVRSFRYVRFRDAEPKDYNQMGETVSAKRLQCERQPILKIWDYDEMGSREDRRFHLQEGGHYRVTNLTPTKVKAWAKPDEADEIHLSAGQNSKWRRVNVVS